MLNFVIIRPVGAEIHADGQIDMTKLLIACRKLALTLKNGWK
jgi:hypothetical protein